MWIPRPASGAGAAPLLTRKSLPPETVQIFQRAAAVRDALFSGTSQTPLARFQLALELSGDASQVVINIDGQTLSYTAGQAARAADVQWTGASGQAQVEFLPPVAGSPSQLRETGPWAWFKILDQAQVQPLSASQFREARSAPGKSPMICAPLAASIRSGCGSWRGSGVRINCDA